MSLLGSAKGLSSVVLAISICPYALAAGWDETHPQDVAAFESGDLPAIKRALKENGNYKDDRNILATGFRYAVRSRKLDAVEYLIGAGWLDSYREERKDEPIILDAASAGVPIIELLLKNGEDVNARSTHGDTPLHFAALDGWPDTVRYLVEHGANVSAKNKSGRNPLEELLYQHQLDVRNGSRMSEEFVSGRMKVIELLRQHTPRDQVIPPPVPGALPPEQSAPAKEANAFAPQRGARFGIHDGTRALSIVAVSSLLLGALFLSRKLAGHAAAAGAVLGALSAFGGFIVWSFATGGLALRGPITAIALLSLVVVLGAVIGYVMSAAGRRTTRRPILRWALTPPAAGIGWMIGLAVGLLLYALYEALGMCPAEYSGGACKGWEEGIAAVGLTIGCFFFVLLPPFAAPSHSRLIALAALIAQLAAVIVMWQAVPSITWHLVVASTLPASVAFGVVHMLNTREAVDNET